MLRLPKELEKYRKELESYVIPFIRIKANKGKTNLTQSKFGGHPYLPIGVPHPLDESNVPMKLLAQLNFSEIPSLTDFPEKGILQFFISATDDVHGLDFDNATNQANFRVVYYEDVLESSHLVNDFSYLDEIDEDYFPIQQEAALEFEVSSETISMSDFRFENLEIDTDEETEDGRDLGELFWDELSSEGHKLGGYPFFTQHDPRDGDIDLESHTVTLLQIDSDDSIDLMWGDSGVANFFITKEDLKNKNFTKVLYNWDCH